MSGMDAILVVNAGSSSLKFQIFAIEAAGLVHQVRGQIDGIGTRPRLHVVAADRQELVNRNYPAAEIPDLPAAIGQARNWLATLRGLNCVPSAIASCTAVPTTPGRYSIDEAVLARLAAYQELAPLHQPNNLAPIRMMMEVDPAIPQVACFDTAFHRDHPAHADFYALPRSLYDEGVRRYGFHGLSYEYIAERLHEVAPEAARGRTIVAHLGSGASMCALLAGRSVESTMGFTALDGLPMGTRPGQLDPGVVLYLIAHKGMSVQAVADLLYRESGLKGLSGISSDMRELLASDDPRAAFAVDHFVYRCGLNVGLLAAALGGVDAFVFTAGVGENSATIRARIAGRLAWLGAELDPAANEAGATLISTSASRVALFVIPTDEELMIARHTHHLVGAPLNTRSERGHR